MNFCKKEQLNVLKYLLRIERTLDRCKSIIAEETCRIIPSDDQERYLKMAMKLDPSDPENLHRKTVIKSVANITKRQKLLKTFKHII